MFRVWFQVISCLFFVFFPNKYLVLQTNSFTIQSKKSTYGYQGGGGGGINWETRIHIYTLLYIKQIPSKNLMYSTGNST